LIGGGVATLTGESMRGWLAGAQIGYNWQYGSVVTGVEFDLSAADINGTSSTASVSPGPGSVATETLEHHVKYLGTVRGRLGWTPLNTVLLYGTGGLAWERLQEKSTEVDVVPAGTTVGEFTSLTNHFGWVGGAGVEAMLGSPNWIGRLEYLHYDFGRVGDQAVSTAAVQSAGRQTIDTVRAGVSYKFGPQMPAVTSAPLYTKAPPAPALQNWTGFYIGAHGGYGWKKNSFDGFANLFIVPIDGPDSRGFVAGGQAGYNWQYRQVVAGIEIDGSATGIKGTSGPGVIGTIASVVWSDEVKYLGTVRGRLGWTPVNNVLLYGTGGLAWERAHRTEIGTSTISGVESVTTPRDHFGWAAGAGAEFMLGSSNWIGRVEYLHYDFGQVESSFTFTSSTPGESSTENGGRQTINMVRAGVSYKFTP
jgi:opacity protein-like surface antigen